MLALVAMQTPSILCRPVPCKLRPPSAVCHASSVHRPSSLPPSFSLFSSDQPWSNLQLHVTDLPPSPAVATAFRSNHRSRHPKPQARYRFSQSCHHRYPSLSLKPSLSTSLMTGVLSEEGGQFFLC